MAIKIYQAILISARLTKLNTKLLSKLHKTFGMFNYWSQICITADLLLCKNKYQKGAWQQVLDKRGYLATGPKQFTWHEKKSLCSNNWSKLCWSTNVWLVPKKNLLLSKPNTRRLLKYFQLHVYNNNRSRNECFVCLFVYWCFRQFSTPFWVIYPGVNPTN